MMSYPIFSDEKDNIRLKAEHKRYKDAKAFCEEYGKLVEKYMFCIDSSEAKITDLCSKGNSLRHFSRYVGQHVSYALNQWDEMKRDKLCKRISRKEKK